MSRAVSTGLLVMLLFSGLMQAGLLLGPVTAQEEDPSDRYDGQPNEWEKQVAQDARGDVLVTWPGSIDLLYMTMGNLHSIDRGESFLFIRIGYNITEAGDETIPTQQETPTSVLPDIPPLAAQRVLSTIEIQFNVTTEQGVRTESILLVTTDFGETWATDQGLLVTDNPREDSDDKEVLYAAPLRRFSLEEGDILNDYNVTSHRHGRLVDTMHGFDPANDYLPGYMAIHPLLEDPAQVVPPLPLPFPLPPTPEPPQPPEEAPETPDPADIVPNHPYPVPPSTGPQGVPKGTPHPKDLEEWDPDRDGPVPWDLEKTAEKLQDPESGAAWSTEFVITEGRSRFVVRSHQEVVFASIQEVGFGNFTIDNLMSETEQIVGLFWSGPPDMGWLMRYGLDMPNGVKHLSADGTVEMSLIAAPMSLFARPSFIGAAVFISNWGGIEIVPVVLQSTTERMQDPRAMPGRTVILPDNPKIEVLNLESSYRVNERRNMLIQIRDEETGQFISQLSGVRAYIYPEGAAPNQLPYQLREKPWMDGVYEVPFVFDRPGAWHIRVFLFDYPPDADGGGWPNEAFIARVDYRDDTTPLMPFSLALMSVGLIVTAVWARERIGKSR
jgi:hypothetical protein